MEVLVLDVILYSTWFLLSLAVFACGKVMPHVVLLNEILNN